MSSAHESPFRGIAAVNVELDDSNVDDHASRDMAVQELDVTFTNRTLL